jgi:hypothetical protein
MLRIGVALLALLFQSQRPLPDSQAFVAEFRKSLHTDDLLLSSYTFTEKRTRVTLDSNGRPKNTEVNVFEVFPGSCERPEYRRQIVKNGSRVSEKDLARQDRDYKKQVESGAPSQTKTRGVWRRRDNCDAKATDQKVINDVFGVYDIRVLGRESVGGEPTVLVSFKPRAGYKPQTEQGEMLQHVSGRAWVSEDDYQLARVEADVFDDLSLSRLAKLRKGTRVTAERRKFNDEVWLPARAEVSLVARLLVRGFNIKETIEYSGHKKFTVDTILSFEEEKNEGLK